MSEFIIELNQGSKCVFERSVLNCSSSSSTIEIFCCSHSLKNRSQLKLRGGDLILCINAEYLCLR